MDAYLSLAEFSISLAGFTSVVVVFVHKDEAWLEFDKFRVINALLASLGASFLSLIPWGLMYLNFREKEVFPIHSIIITAYIAMFIASVLYRSRKILSAEDRAQLPKVLVRTLILLGVFLIILHLSKLIGLISLALNGLNYFSIIYLLVVSTFAFSRIIFYRPKDKAE